jgi:hypothetical protein
VHSLIGTTLRASYNRVEPTIIKYRDYKHFNEASFRNDLANFTEDEEINDPNVAYENFLTFFQNTVEKHAPTKQKTVRGNDKGFSDKPLRKAWYIRSRLRNKFNKNKTPENWNNYKKQRNICTSLKRKALNRYFHRKKASPKGFWKTFSPYLSNKGHTIEEDILLLEKGELVQDRKEVADLFNEYYINIIENSTGKKVNVFNF